ncbi:tyrosine kinase, putative, partial [Entamoeba invadens IP1]
DVKLGESSFGVVYKGSFRGNVVAIKKMKTVLDDERLMGEFENEVSMLDKFRCEYIVHFYGAVFIPNKACMVIEFAQYGSLQDLMKHKTMMQHKEFRIFMIMGYYTETLNQITFLCVGTPVYMAPEVLNKKKYTKSADVFSFSISLFECAIWKDPYLDKQFKFAWDIVDFVVSGKRLKRPSYLNEDIYNIVDDMWCQDVHKRINVRDVILKLESINI